MTAAGTSVNGARLWDSLMRMAQIGATSKGGCNRQALTDLDRAGRELFTGWCRELGCAIEVDALGNIFARRVGRDDAAPVVMTGSHLDTQPTGGRFDGVYGVLAGLEVFRTLEDKAIPTERPLELVVWTNEEGYRFDPAMMGSGVFAGVFPAEEILDKRDRDGLRLGDELARIGYAGRRPARPPGPIAAYLEAHIEQGPVLEQRGKTIGIVTGAQGIRAVELSIRGQEAHAGPTPMEMRRDALLPAARIALEINRIARARPDGRGTLGELRVRPGSRNIVPGEAYLMIDLRHPDSDELEAMHQELRAYVEQLAREAHPECAFEWLGTWLSPVVPFDPQVVARVRQSAQRRGYACQDIVSGAGHDACYLARVAPTAMIFVPCEGGISHNEAESARPEDLEAGCNVLLDALLASAGASD
ncbi:MAG: allantoate amidohydrolase [Gammaproteobacteria bacterium SG8_30]|nr:MAG: allantoate amidohydrolase [Gammaproteobacteria bacterium SG8_30]